MARYQRRKQLSIYFMLLNLLNCFYSCERIKTYKTTVSKTAQARKGKSFFDTRKLTLYRRFRVSPTEKNNVGEDDRRSIETCLA